MAKIRIKVETYKLFIHFLCRPKFNSITQVTVPVYWQKVVPVVCVVVNKTLLAVVNI